MPAQCPLPTCHRLYVQYCTLSSDRSGTIVLHILSKVDGTLPCCRTKLKQTASLTTSVTLQIPTIFVEFLVQGNSRISCWAWPTGWIPLHCSQLLDRVLKRFCGTRFTPGTRAYSRATRHCGKGCQPSPLKGSLAKVSHA